MDEVLAAVIQLYPPKDYQLRVWHIALEDGAKVKNFLRLSHL